MSELQDLYAALTERGWTVKEVLPDSEDNILVVFDLMPGRNPSWSKAIECPSEDATPDRIEHEMRVWQANVLWRLDNAQFLAPVIRKMLVEHGVRAVRAAMGERHDA